MFEIFFIDYHGLSWIITDFNYIFTG